MLVCIYVILVNLLLYTVYNLIVYRESVLDYLKSLNRDALELGWFLFTILSSCIGVLLALVVLFGGAH